MSAAFLVLLTLYAAHALVTNRRQSAEQSRRIKFIGVLFHTPLLGIACYIAAREGVFSRQLVSPAYIGAGLIAGHLIFGVSLLVTHLSWRAAAVQFFDLTPLWRYVVDNPATLLRFIGVSAGEELMYRAAAQPLMIEYTGSPVWGVLIVAAVFSAVHRHFFRNPLGQSAEFAGFAIAIGVLYYWTGSLILVLVIHAVRNIEIAYLEHVLETEKDEDSAPVLRECERACAHRDSECP